MNKKIRPRPLNERAFLRSAMDEIIDKQEPKRKLHLCVEEITLPNLVSVKGISIHVDLQDISKEENLELIKMFGQIVNKMCL